MKTSLFSFGVFVFVAAVMPGQRTFGQTQHEMTQSAAKDFERADAELNAVYKKALATLDEEGKSKLTKAQRAWVAFRDAQATFEADENRGGSMEPMIIYGAQAKLTQERVIVLRELLTDRKPGVQ